MSTIAPMLDPISNCIPSTKTAADISLVTGDPAEPGPLQMHRALKNTEILSNVFKLFDAGFDSDERRKSRKHLYWAALASKDFLEPALDHIWRSMNRLLPLLKLLPALKLVNNIYVIAGVILNRHWARMDSYGRRVRYFTVEPSLPIETCLQLIHLRKNPLLPNLRQLQCPAISRELISEVPLILGPNIERVTFNGQGPLAEPMIGTLTSILALKALSLRQLIINVPIAWDPMDNTFEHLNHLELSQPVDLALLRKLSGALPKLQSLTICLFKKFPKPNDSRTANFKHLKSVHVTTHNLVHLPHFFLLVKTATLESIVVTTTASCMSDEDSPITWASFWKEIRRWVGSLRSLHIKVNKERERRRNLLDLNGFRLERLTLEGWPLPYNQTLQRLAKSCPDIQELRLGVDHRGLITPAILYDFAKWCPKLTHLQIWINWIDIPLIDSDFTSHGLKEVLIGGLNDDIWEEPCFDDRTRIARYIDRLFPHVVLQVYPPGSPQAEKWEEVGNLLIMCQDVRRDEVRRCTSGGGHFVH